MPPPPRLRVLAFAASMWGDAVAQKRMFSLQVVDTDKFMDMPTSSQALYFHLGMHGDDDGFVSSPRKIARAAGCNDDDIRLLAAKGFIIPFDSGVVVITDWRINNTLQNDRYHETVYQEEKALLKREKNGKYSVDSTLFPSCIQNGSMMESEPNLTKPNITQPSVAQQNQTGKKEESRCCFTGNPPQNQGFIPPTVDEVRTYCNDNNFSFSPERFVDYYQAKGWMISGTVMMDWKAAARIWERKEKQNERTGKTGDKPAYAIGTVV